MIRWFAGHPTAANLLLVLFVAAGVIAIPSLKRETFPDFRPVEAEIVVLYRGASAADDARGGHEAGDTTAAGPHPLVLEFGVDARRAVGAVRVGVGLLDVGKEHQIGGGPGRERTSLPAIVGGTGDLKHTA